MNDQKDLVIGQGQTLFMQGEKGGELFFIKQGEVELTVRNDETGETAVVAKVGPRSVLGTMSFLEGEPRSATAKAITEVAAVKITQVQREKLLKSVPTWLAVLIKDLSSNLRRINEEFAHLRAQNDVLQKRLSAKESKDKRADEKAKAETTEVGGKPPIEVKK
jgi:CRP-like cAMP-binding protein